MNCKDSDNYIIGEKVDSRLKHITAAGVDWKNYPSLIQICGDYDTLLGKKVTKLETSPD